MATKLNTPEPHEIAATQAITGFQLFVPHTKDGSGDMVIDRPEITLASRIMTWNQAGVRIADTNMVLTLADIPPAVRDGLKQLYGWLEGQAKARGFIASGVSEEL